jgi:hypothetical protein
MTIATDTGINSKARKTLSQQIDRLDSLLDGLAENLQEAVADTVKAAVGAAAREAVGAVLAELFSSPELLALLRGISPAPAVPPASEQAGPSGPSLWQHLGNLCQGVRHCLGGLRAACGWGLRRAWGWAAGLGRQVAQGLAWFWQQCRSLGQWKYQLLGALGIGSAVGVGAWLVGPWLSAPLSGVGGFVASLWVQGWLWLRKTLDFSPQRGLSASGRV